VLAYQLPSSARAGLLDVAHHSADPELVRAREIGTWLGREGHDAQHVLASVDNDVQGLALAVWSRMPFERFETAHALAQPGDPPPDLVIELGGDSLAFEAYLQALRGTHALELAFEPHEGQLPRVYRVVR
jgi:hypothetical protein